MEGTTSLSRGYSIIVAVMALLLLLSCHFIVFAFIDVALLSWHHINRCHCDRCGVIVAWIVHHCCCLRASIVVAITSFD